MLKEITIKPRFIGKKTYTPCKTETDNKKNINNCAAIEKKKNSTKKVAEKNNKIEKDE